MTRAEQEQLAAMLASARQAGTQLETLPPNLIPASADEGYSVNQQVAAKLGWAPLGWKIAATTPEMQRRLRATEPIYGRTFQQFAESSPVRLRFAELLDPIIECEFFFRMGRDLPAREHAWSADEVRDAVAAVHAGIEVAECRFPLTALPAMPAILADGAASGRYVIGDEITDWRALDLSTMPVTLSVNSVERRHGSGREVMGDPLGALVWLANSRRRWGDGLRAGELVSSGTATGMLLAKAGDRMRADFGRRWSADVDFL